MTYAYVLFSACECYDPCSEERIEENGGNLNFSYPGNPIKYIECTLQDVSLISIHDYDY